MSGASIAAIMAPFAFGALGASLPAGRRLALGSSTSLRARMQALTLIVVAQTALTWRAPRIGDAAERGR